jgi:ubiquinone/menaquinone biosynthesis C-methylase UbiE
VLDVGCGEGRFCRQLAALGAKTVGLDLVRELVREARARQPDGAFVEGSGEALPFRESCFDLVISYVTLVDIPDFRKAISEWPASCCPAAASSPPTSAS